MTILPVASSKGVVILGEAEITTAKAVATIAATKIQLTNY